MLGRRAFLTAGPIGALLVAVGLRRKPTAMESDWARIQTVLREVYGTVGSPISAVERAAQKLAWVRR